TRECSAQRFDFGLVLTQKPRLLGLVKRLGFAVPLLAACFKGSALFFLTGDDGRDFRLLGGNRMFSGDRTLLRLAHALRRGHLLQRLRRQRRGNDLDRLITDMMGRKIGKVTAQRKRAHRQAASSSGMTEACTGWASRLAAVS